MSAHLFKRSASVAVGDGHLPNGRVIGAAIRKAVFRELCWAANDDGTVPPHRAVIGGPRNRGKGQPAEILPGLAATLELSRNPVLWSLHTLAADGWVTYEPGAQRRPGRYAVVIERLVVAQDGGAHRAPPVADTARHGENRQSATVADTARHGGAHRAPVLDIDVDLGAVAPELEHAPPPRIPDEAIAAAAVGMAQWRAVLHPAVIVNGYAAGDADEYQEA